MIIIYHYDDYALNTIVTKMVSFAEKCARLLEIFSPTWSLTSPPVSTASTGSGICISCDAMLTPRIWYTFNRCWRRWSWWWWNKGLDQQMLHILAGCSVGGWWVSAGYVRGLLKEALIRSAHTAKERKRYSYIHLALIKELWKRSKYLSSVSNKHHVSKETLSLKI